MGAASATDRLRLTAYLGERERVGGALLADRLVDLYEEHGIDRAIVLRGIEGFGGAHRLRTDRLLTLSEDLPVVAVALDRRERIEGVAREVAQLQRRGLLTLEETRAVVDAPATEVEEDVKLTIHLGRRERVGGRPAFVAVCELLHADGVAGASALLGVDGTTDGRRRRARFFAANSDVPMTILAVGEAARIGATAAKLAAILREPELTLERVRVCKRDGTLIEAPHAAREGEEGSGGRWQKLTIVTSEAARVEGAAVHVRLLRELRAAGAAGATSVRGVWGFHGAHSPHGDRLLSLRRHVPVLTTVIDTPARIAQLFGVVDELTAERGLVTSEPVEVVGAAAR
jgi:PII-like signaling protein